MNTTQRHGLGLLVALVFLPVAEPAAGPPWMLSGNENKIDLTSGAALAVPPTGPDSLSLLDFSVFPPRVTHLEGVANSVIGPPSNIAITPDGRLALVANSVKVDPSDPGKFLPLDQIHLLDLTTSPPRLRGSLAGGQQPSGMSISRDGRIALVANRAGGTVSVLRIAGGEVIPLTEVKVGEPAESASDVALTPDARRALVSLQKAGVLVELAIDGERVAPTGRKFSVFGQPYRVLITPDGALGLTAGMGYGNGLDADVISVIDLAARPPATTAYVTIGAVPESIELSPDGRLLAAVTMDGSNLGSTNALRTMAGGLTILRRKGKTFEITQRLPTGRIPEGVAFTPDGRYLVVQCHPDRELRIYSVRGGRVKETGVRVKVPGMPSSLRAVP